MSLTACLITRNEERFLPGCLQSLRSHVDEIVLVDTGSSDATLEIAAASGSRIVTHVWGDDFSAARNAAWPHVRTDWLLWIDADERLENGAALRPLIDGATPHTGAFALERHDVVKHPESGRTETNTIPIVRLLRNRPGIRYLGSVHERPDETVLEAGLEITTATGPWLTHLVNELPREALLAKQRRYLALLDRELALHATDHRARYYRAKTLWFLGELAVAESELEAVARATDATTALRASAHCMLATLTSEAGRDRDADAHLDAAHQLEPASSLARYTRAEHAYRVGRFDEAYETYGGVLVSREPPRDGELESRYLFADLRISREKQAYKRGCCLLALGRVAEARTEFARGIAVNPADAAAYFGLAHAALLEGDEAEARRSVTLSVDRDPTWLAPKALQDQLDAIE